MAIQGMNLKSFFDLDKVNFTEEELSLPYENNLPVIENISVQYSSSSGASVDYYSFKNNTFSTISINKSLGEVA